MPQERTFRSIANEKVWGSGGYPMVTVLLYGPNDRLAIKVTFFTFADETEYPSRIVRFECDGEVRTDPSALAALEAYLSHGINGFYIEDAIRGCPHEDEFKGRTRDCPHCPFWAGRKQL